MSPPIEQQRWTAPRDLDPDFLHPGDQIQVLPAAPDADIAWVPMWSRPLVDPEDARWMTVATVVRSDATNNVAVELEDGAVLVLAGAFDRLVVRIPCEVTP